MTLTPKEHWDQLHVELRFRPQYPSEEVVRFLLRHFEERERNQMTVLDIGVGGGRHVKLLCDLGFKAIGVDLSCEGLRHCRSWLMKCNQHAGLCEASMTSLPFDTESFDAAISCGVFYYTDSSGMNAAIAEMHRVLRPGGYGFVQVRTTDDHRYGKGPSPEPDTFESEKGDAGESGLIQHYLSETAVPMMFAGFSSVSFEKSETTLNNRRLRNSEWLITVHR